MPAVVYGVHAVKSSLLERSFFSAVDENQAQHSILIWYSPLCQSVTPEGLQLQLVFAV